MAKRRGLGRGLGALIPTEAPDVSRETSDSMHLDKPSVAEQHSPSAKPHRVGTERNTGLSPETAHATGRSRSPTGASRGSAKETSSEEIAPVDGVQLREIPLENITPNPKQPRSVFDEDALTELVASIQQVGVLQPIVVRETERDSYQLIMGERRFRASREARLSTIPAVIRQTPDTDLLRDALLENLHRSDLNPLEEAAAYQQLLDEFDVSHAELAERIGRSRSVITNTLRLLNLPGRVQKRVAAGVLSAGHARALLALDDTELQEHLANRVVAEGLSVRSTEELTTEYTLEGARPKRPSAPVRTTNNSEADAFAEKLSDCLDTKVTIHSGKKKGRIVIEFAGIDDLSRLSQLLLSP